MKILLAIALLGSSLAIAQSKLELFESFYSTDAQKGKCGENSQGLISKWNEQGLDTTDSKVLYIKGSNSGYLGLVKYYQNRWGGFHNYQLSSGESYAANTTGGWYFHAVVLDNGLIYDSSFKERPTVLPLKEYVLSMFTLPEDLGSKFYQKKAAGLKYLTQYTVNLFIDEDEYTCNNLHLFLDNPECELSK